tara:strand:+ start:1962 stop:2765 length:804 start_codon:yes stop_codon:yes gene_type:complete
MHNLHLLGGLPRSGITLLSAMLNKNTNIYVTTTSPFVEILWRNYGFWFDPDYIDDTGTDKMQDVKVPFLRSIAGSYFKELTTKPTIIDKRRQWQHVNNIEMYTDIYGKPPKIICPVRDVVDIITSYKVLYTKNNLQWSYESLKGNRFENSYLELKNSYSKYPDCFLLVNYSDIVNDPQAILDRICKFIGEPSFVYDAKSPIQAHEKEADYGINGLHTLRTTLSDSGDDAKEILTDDEYNTFSNWNFWKEDSCITNGTKPLVKANASS